VGQTFPVRRRLGIVSVAALLGACGGGGATTAAGPPRGHLGTETVPLTWNGDHRTYLLHRPSRLAPGVTPAVVVVLHGASLTAEQTERYYHWDGLADTDGFAVVYPQGIAKSWNAGSCCGDAPARGTDDVGFVGAAFDDAVRRVGGDRARLYLTGVSNGAMLALRYACERPGRLAALGSVAGTLTAPCDHLPQLPFIEIHGLHDRAVPWGPGPGTPASGSASRAWASDTVDRIRAADGCHDPSVTTAGPVHTEVDRCPPGIDLEVITIDGAGHQWPGAILDAARAAYDGPEDQPDTHVDATAQLWAFFAPHHLGAGP